MNPMGFETGPLAWLANTVTIRLQRQVGEVIAHRRGFMIESDAVSESIIKPQCIIDLKHVRSWA